MVEPLVFERGRIVERGSFAELTAQGGLFAELARAQFMTAATAEPRLHAQERPA